MPTRDISGHSSPPPPPPRSPRPLRSLGSSCRGAGIPGTRRLLWVMWCHPRAELPGNPRGRSPTRGGSRLTFALPDPRAPPLSGYLGSQAAKPEGSRPSGEGRPRDTREGGGERARRERSRDSPPFPQTPGAQGREAGRRSRAHGQESPLPLRTVPFIRPISLSQRGAALYDLRFFL